jgi:hypothetical protein
MTSAVALVISPAEAQIKVPLSSTFGETNAIEQVRSVCVRRRVCGPHGRCAWKTACRRIPDKGSPRTKGLE